MLIDNKLMNHNDMPQLIPLFLDIVAMKDTIVITEVVIILLIHHMLKNLKSDLMELQIFLKP